MDVLGEFIQLDPMLPSEAEISSGIDLFSTYLVGMGQGCQVAPVFPAHDLDGDQNPASHPARLIPFSFSFGRTLSTMDTGNPSALAISAVFTCVFPSARKAWM